MEGARGGDRPAGAAAAADELILKEDVGDQLFAPFRRTDQFGDRGMRPQPLAFRVRLFLQALVLVPLKVSAAAACVASFYAVIRLSPLFPARRRAGWVAALGKAHARACLFAVGFTEVKWVKLTGWPVRGASPRGGGGGAGDGGGDGTGDGAAPPPPAAAAIVSNHCGWADILIHMARFFPAFVARDTTAGLPLVGAISKAMDCIYVDRGRAGAGAGGPNGNGSGGGGGVSAAVRARVEAAAAGRGAGTRPLLLFPEATTTNGRFLLPFKTGAFLAGAPVLPVLIRYEGGDEGGEAGGGVSPCWESISAARHIFLVMASRARHRVTCLELPVYVPSPAERADPRAYAAGVRRAMAAAGGLADARATFADKLRYHALLRGAAAAAAARGGGGGGGGREKGA